VKVRFNPKSAVKSDHLILTERCEGCQLFFEDFERQERGQPCSVCLTLGFICPGGAHPKKLANLPISKVQAPACQLFLEDFTPQQLEEECKGCAYSNIRCPAAYHLRKQLVYFVRSEDVNIWSKYFSLCVSDPPVEGPPSELTNAIQKRVLLQLDHGCEAELVLPAEWCQEHLQLPLPEQQPDQYEFGNYSVVDNLVSLGKYIGPKQVKIEFQADDEHSVRSTVPTSTTLWSAPINV